MIPPSSGRAKRGPNIFFATIGVPFATVNSANNCSMCKKCMLAAYPNRGCCAIPHPPPVMRRSLDRRAYSRELREPGSSKPFRTKSPAGRSPSRDTQKAPATNRARFDCSERVVDYCCCACSLWLDRPYCCLARISRRTRMNRGARCLILTESQAACRTQFAQGIQD
jgi:hypothetical protein